MPPPPKPITPEDIANDAGHTAAFLRAVDGVLPGHIDESVLAFLDSLGSNRMTLELLAKALNGAPQVR